MNLCRIITCSYLKERRAMNKELSQALKKKMKKRFPDLDLKPEDMCHVTIITLSTLAGFLRNRVAFSGAKLLKYAGKAVEDFLVGKEG
jgi:hypothetical protein